MKDGKADNWVSRIEDLAAQLESIEQQMNQSRKKADELRKFLDDFDTKLKSAQQLIVEAKALGPIKPSNTV